MTQYEIIPFAPPKGQVAGSNPARDASEINGLRKIQEDLSLKISFNNITHTRTKANSPQTNGICERFHKTILQEFYQVTFRKKIYDTIEELQKDLDEWMEYYNNERTHQGKMCCGRTPIQTLMDSKHIWKEKFIN